MNRCIALLGRSDEPTDAVEEYCKYLGAALRPLDFELRLERVNWSQTGWGASLRELRIRAASIRGEWALVQYTALAWSSRGFPGKFLKVLRVLRQGGARAAVVFHDAEPYEGVRLIDRLRRWSQLRTMRMTTQLADMVIFTVPPERLSWVRSVRARAVFIPVGANLTLPPQLSPATVRKNGLTVGVFSITGGTAGAQETCEIIAAVRFASQAIGKLRLNVFGRHAELREKELRDGLCNVPVDLSVEGVLDEKRVAEKLTACDVLLFVRGPISTRRGSAIAGIACGLPVIASSGTETAAPITEAGVAFYDPQKGGCLGKVLLRVLQDEPYRRELRERSRRAQEQHFSWAAIATRYAEFLK